MKIEYDIHAHTHLSLCANETATIENYVQSAKRNGLTLVGIADHMWDPAIPLPDCIPNSQGGPGLIYCYNTQIIPRCREILKEIEQTDTEGIEFLFGGELDYCPGMGASITEAEAEKLDFMVVPVSHTHQIMDKKYYEPYQKHADYMLHAVMEICEAPTAKYVTSLAHPFDPVCCPYSPEFVYDCISDKQFEEVFSALKEKGIAVEINGGAFQVPREQVANMGHFRALALAKKVGCKFTFGSDSHKSGYQDTAIPNAQFVADSLGLTEQDVLSIDEIKSKRK